MVKRVVGLGAAAGLAVALVSGVAAQATSPAGSGSVRHLVFIDHQDQSKFIDTAPKGQDIGDSFVFSETVTQHGHQVGVAGGQCVIVRLTKTRAYTSCAVSVSLPEGQLTVQGLQSFPLSDAPTPPSTFAVTGGTGAYRAARGQVTVTDLSDTDSRVSVDLISG